MQHLLGDFLSGRCGGETAQAGFPQACRKRIADFSHGVNDFVCRNMRRDAGERHIGGADCVDRTDHIALDARNLYESGNRIANQAEQIAKRHRKRMGALFCGSA